MRLPWRRSRPAPMPCNELVELITDYLEGALPAEDVRRFEAHLALCDPCVEYLEQFKGVIEASGRLDPEALPPEVQGDLVAVFRGWAAQQD